MKKKTFRFSNSNVDYYLKDGFSSVAHLVDKKNSIVVTDEHVFELHANKFKSWKTVVIKPGEDKKTQATADDVIQQLIHFEADRSTTLLAVGGGVVTDLAQYVSGIYMRGISCGLVPTTLLSMVDASIGGKNGIDVGMYKNMVGLIRQPSFIVFDPQFLSTLPDPEWRNGFAEIIKHASIKDSLMFRELEQNNVSFYQQNKREAYRMIQRNALLKTKVVQKDEFEKGDRKLLNFGHTLGHALENQYTLPHGEAISIGMSCAAGISQKLSGFRHADRLIRLLDQYGLPTSMNYDKDKVLAVLKMDKKKTKDGINFILLEKIGKAVIQQISLQQLYEYL